jgi:hypothetical protein
MFPQATTDGTERTDSNPSVIIRVLSGKKLRFGFAE